MLKHLRVALAFIIIVITLPLQAQNAPAVETRDFTQTVVTAAGDPVAGTTVMATYCVNNKISYLSGVTNARGEMLWKALPRVRTIVWGDDLPAQVIEPNDQVTALPDRRNEPYLEMSITIPLNGARGLVQTFSCSRGMQPKAELCNRPDQAAYRYTEQMAPTTRYTLLVVLPGEPPSLAMLDQVYLPFIQNQQRHGELTLTSTPITVLECHFSSRGKPVTRVSRLGVQRLGSGAGSLSENIVRSIVRAMEPQQLPGDGYRICLPGPGRYRLLVDLNNETTAPMPGLVVDVPQEGKRVQIELPAPLLTVPVGTEVQWSTRNAPLRTDSLIATRNGPASAIFGTMDDLFAAWYRPAPDTLQVFRGDNGQLTRHTLQNAMLTVEAQEERNTWPIYLLPSLKSTNPRNVVPENPLAWPVQSFCQRKPLQYGRNDLPLLWSGKYLVQYVSQLVEVEIAEGKENNITVPLGKADGLKPTSNRLITLRGAEQLPVVKPLHRAALAGARDLPMMGGDRPLCSVFADGNAISLPETFTISSRMASSYGIPRNTKTLTFYYPGVGVIRDVPVPPPAEIPATILLEGWQPGVDITGKILDREGNPLAETPIRLQTLFGGGYTDATDGAGRFHFVNLLPGTVFLSCRQRDKVATWTLTIPQDGLTNLTLTMQQAISFVNGAARNQIWWFPQDGAPVCLNTQNPYSWLCGLPTGKGTFWVDDNYRQAESVLRSMTLLPETALNLSDDKVDTAYSYLGLFLPLDLQVSQLPGVELVGLEKLHGFVARFDPYRVWQYSPEMSLLTGQVGPLPVGQYHLTVYTHVGSRSQEVTVPAHGAYAAFAYPKP